MSIPSITQTWTISPNNRYTFGSVLGAMSNFILSLKNFLKTTMGYTVKGSSDGSSAAMDGTDRWSTATNAQTRNNGAAGAMSWFVLTDAAGVDWCFSFNSASDDIYRLAHSTGGNYVAAATATQQPTATDECFDAASGTWVNATASLDRIWHMWGSSDKKMWRAVTARTNTAVSYIAGEKFTSSIISPATFTLTTGGGTVGAVKSYYNNNGVAGTGFAHNTVISWSVNNVYSATLRSDLARVHTDSDRNVLGYMSGEAPFGVSNNTFSADKPWLQGTMGQLIFPISMYSRTANVDGKLGNKIDVWYSITSAAGTPGLGDYFGNYQLLALGSGIILPWDGTTVGVFI
jgi:hypothetical protein